MRFAVLISDKSSYCRCTCIRLSACYHGMCVSKATKQKKLAFKTIFTFFTEIYGIADRVYVCAFSCFDMRIRSYLLAVLHIAWKINTFRCLLITAPYTWGIATFLPKQCLNPVHNKILSSTNFFAKLGKKNLFSTAGISHIVVRYFENKSNLLSTESSFFSYQQDL